MHIHYVIHESYEGPGAFVDWAGEREFHQTATHLYRGDKLPENTGFDLLVVLGGPQSPLTTVAECAYFNAEEESRFIGRCIAAGKAVVGVCLGAQLTGQALGADFAHSPEKEIGYYPITLTSDGQKHPLFGHFRLTEIVGHWHSDMPGLLPDSKVIASSEGCPGQIVAYSDIVYGFQCHLEFTPESIPDLIDSAFDDRLLAEKWVQTPEEIRSFDTVAMNRLLYQFLDGLVRRYQKNDLL
ncbi:glutamine amidotransferase-related protein [Vibrio quintilis]|uniref:Glutamine amidotransferase n=1 Tax=Vibrio quintilis TaxID=1117707 RepID=A0A1M7YQX6_9VIBR|nr:GMP synthase [Vibrio quintilis]SHO55024.1 glutamine amidotransferase [Vibrio quintilis]